jgi:Zn-dependent protease
LERDFPEFWTVELGDALKENGRLKVLINDLLWVNIFWGLINLLPLFPLDGGHIAREILVSQDPQNGWIRSLWVSVFTGGALVVFALWRRDWYMGILFGMLAYTSYAAIQQYTGRGGFGGGRPW